MNFLIGSGFIGISIFLLRFPYELEVLIAVLTIIGLIPFCLTLHYWFSSIGLRITIDVTNELIEVMHRGRFNTFKFSEVTSIEISEHIDIGGYGFDFF